MLKTLYDEDLADDEVILAWAGKADAAKSLAVPADAAASVRKVGAACIGGSVCLRRSVCVMGGGVALGEPERVWSGSLANPPHSCFVHGT